MLQTWLGSLTSLLLLLGWPATNLGGGVGVSFPPGPVTQVFSAEIRNNSWTSVITGAGSWYNFPAGGRGDASTESDWTATESDRIMVVPIDGTVGNLRVQLSADCCGAGDTVTFELRHCTSGGGCGHGSTTVACTLTDAMLRRLDAGTAGAPEAGEVEVVAGVMAAALGWNAARQAEELRALLETYRP